MARRAAAADGRRRRVSGREGAAVVSHSESTNMFMLDQVVPWGRSFDEYQRMFALTDGDLGVRIIGCGDGPASFNAEATRRGARVVSVDPLYRWEVGQIRDRIASDRRAPLSQNTGVSLYVRAGATRRNWRG